jgi:NADH-quinone oxidoreductase subunit C
VLARDDPRIDLVRGVFAGAAWHEREVAELFGVEFVGGDSRRLLLNPEFRERRCGRMKCSPRVPGWIGPEPRSRERRRCAEPAADGASGSSGACDLG